MENRWDFTEKDASFFPMRIYDGGELYGFCPAKATWDHEAVTLYRSLIVSFNCGTMWEDGSLSEQPAWWVNLLSWFIQKYGHEVFVARAKMVLGDGSDSKKINQARPNRGGKHR